MHLIAAVVFLTGGSWFVLFGLGIFLFQRRFNKTRTPVKLLVVDSHARTGREGTYIHLEYKITEGPHSGLQKISESGTFPPMHAHGELIDGYFDVATGEIQSKKDGRLTGWIILGFAGLGGVMLALGVLAGARGISG